MPVNFQDLDQNQPQKPENRRIRIQENGRLVKDNSLPYDDCSGHWFWVFIFLFLRKICVANISVSCQKIRNLVFTAAQ